MADAPVELGELTPDQLKALEVGDLVNSTAVQSQNFQWHFADEAFFTLATHSGVDITFARQETANIRRRLRLAGSTDKGATMEVLGVDSTTSTVLVAQVRYPMDAIGDFFIGLATAAKGHLSEEANAKLLAALRVLTEPDAA